MYLKDGNLLHIENIYGSPIIEDWFVIAAYLSRQYNVIAGQ